MRLAVRLVRAQVWLKDPETATTNASRDGDVLARTRCQGHERLWPGTMEPPPPSSPPNVPSRKPRCRWTPVRWAEPVEPLRSWPSVASESDVCCDNDDVVDVGLFTIGAGTGARQRLKFLGALSLRLGDRDRSALANAQEVVFTADLDVGHGHVELKLRRVDLAQAAALDDDNNEPRGSSSAFSLQWTNSEALEHELKEKALLHSQTQAQLIRRLRDVETKARQLLALRDQGLVLMRTQRATRRIQRWIRAILRRRRAECRRLRREEREQRRQAAATQRALEEAKHAAIRARVVERNRLRTKRFIAEWTAARQSTMQESGSDEEEEEDNHARDLSATRDGGTSRAALHRWMREREELTLRTLQERLMQLEGERERELRKLGLTGRRNHESESDGDEDPPRPLVNAALVHAIQCLHVRK